MYLNPYKIFPEWDEYEIFHDESKENHIIHAFLFVPTRIKPGILSQVNRIRNKYNNDSKLHYNELTGITENIKHKTAKEIFILKHFPFKPDSHKSKSHSEFRRIHIYWVGGVKSFLNFL